MAEEGTSEKGGGWQSMGKRVDALARVIDGDTRKRLAELGGDRDVLQALLFVMCSSHLGQVHDDDGKLIPAKDFPPEVWLSIKKVRYDSEGRIAAVELMDRTGPLKVLAATVGLGSAKTAEIGESISAIHEDIRRIERKVTSVPGEVVDVEEG